MSLRTSQPYLEYMAQITRDAQRGLVLKQLNRKLGSLSTELIEQINNLDIKKLETLGEALLDFTSLSDLNTWLK
jgi:heme oxygenase